MGGTSHKNHQDVISIPSSIRIIHISSLSLSLSLCVCVSRASRAVKSPDDTTGINITLICQAVNCDLSTETNPWIDNVIVNSAPSPELEKHCK
jgi:hypothetical protein